MVTDSNLTGVVKRNSWERNMGEVPDVFLKRVLGGAGGYDFEGVGGEKHSMCVKGYRVVYCRTRWEGG